MDKQILQGLILLVHMYSAINFDKILISKSTISSYIWTNKFENRIENQLNFQQFTATSIYTVHFLKYITGSPTVESLIESRTLFRIRLLGPGLNSSQDSVQVRTLFNFRNFKLILCKHFINNWCLQGATVLLSPPL